jgi:hypothetical protein
MSPVPLPRSSIALMTALLCSMSIPKLAPAPTRETTLSWRDPGMRVPVLRHPHVAATTGVDVG